jgi:type I restriction enzyme, R subunit
MAGAIDWVLTLQQADAAKETTEEGKKRAHRRYADAVVALSKAFALAAASDEAQAIRDEIGFFQAMEKYCGARTRDPADRKPRGGVY